MKIRKYFLYFVYSYTFIIRKIRFSPFLTTSPFYFIPLPPDLGPFSKLLSILHQSMFPLLYVRCVSFLTLTLPLPLPSLLIVVVVVDDEDGCHWRELCGPWFTKYMNQSDIGRLLGYVIRDINRTKRRGGAGEGWGGSYPFQIPVIY